MVGRASSALIYSSAAGVGTAQYLHYSIQDYVAVGIFAIALLTFAVNTTFKILQYRRDKK